MAEPNDLPFDGDDPFESEEEELAAARDIIRRDLAGWILNERNDQAEEEVSAAFVSPPIEAIREYYGQQAPPEWPDQVEETYRIYRVYSIARESNQEDQGFFRHAAVAYRRDENGVSGFVYGLEA